MREALHPLARLFFIRRGPPSPAPGADAKYLRPVGSERLDAEVADGEGKELRERHDAGGEMGAAEVNVANRAAEVEVGRGHRALAGRMPVIGHDRATQRVL